MARRINNRATERELGFGNSIQVKDRLMNADGTFNIDRVTQKWGVNLYHHLVSMSWGLFILNVFLVYILVNTTTGYGRVSPEGLPANILASLESLMGVMSFALISGLLYGRFSRPIARLVFSPDLLVSPFKGGKALMFRVANARKSEIIEAEARLLVAINQEDEQGNITRRFHNLELQISYISFMSLTWTLVHNLDEKSPIYGFSHEELKAAKAEWLIIIKGVDDSYSQTVYDRYSYTAEEMVWDAKFAPILSKRKDGMPYLIVEEVGKYHLLS
jgi:inward rectifier potassium channel